MSKQDKIVSDIKMLKTRNLNRFTGESFERWEVSLTDMTSIDKLHRLKALYSDFIDAVYVVQSEEV